MKETTIIITTSITVQSEDNVDRDEIVCSVKTALRVDNSKLLDSLTLMEEEQTDDELVSEHSLNPVDQESFNKAFNDLLKGSTRRYLNTNRNTDEISKKKTARIEVLNSNGNWLLDYSTDPENSYFWYQFDRVYIILQSHFSLQDEEIQSLMKSMVDTQYKMKGVTPKVLICQRVHRGRDPIQFEGCYTISISRIKPNQLSAARVTSLG